MKRILAAVLATIALLILGWIVQQRWLPADVSIPVATPPSLPAAAAFRAVETTGIVERQRTPDGPWVAVQPGESFDLSDSLRTGPGGRAVLALGDAAVVRVGAESQLRVSEIRERASRIRLEGGQVSGESIADGGRLEVEFRGSDAVAVATEGGFTAVNAGDGFVAVSSSSARVELTSASRTVTVGPGEQSVVRPNLPPSAPRRIEASLFLKLGRPPASVQREANTLVEGRTAPGTLLRVGDVRAVAGSDGRFAVMVSLREGSNSVLVEALSADGRQVRETLPAITVDTKPLDVTGTVDWK